MVGAPRKEEVEQEPDPDEEAPEQVSLSAGREDAQKLRKVERGNQRRVQAEAKQRRQRSTSEKKGKVLPQEDGSLDAELPTVNATSYTQPDEGSDFSKSARNSGFLDASIIDFLSAREKNVLDKATPLPQVDDTVKEKRVRKRKRIQQVGSTTSGIKTRLLDANCPSLANVNSALNFKRNRLYGRRLHRSLDMLPKS